MKKQWMKGLLALMLVVMLAVPTAFADNPQATPDVTPEAVPKETPQTSLGKPQAGVEEPTQPKLTEAQQNELKAIYDQMFDLKKQLIEKYESYGVLDSKKADRMTKHLEEWKKKLEKNGYEPRFERKHRKKKKLFDKD